MTSKYFDENQFLEKIDKLYPVSILNRLFNPNKYKSQQEERTRAIASIKSGNKSLVTKLLYEIPIETTKISRLLTGSSHSNISFEIFLRYEFYDKDVVVVRATLPGKNIIPTLNKRILKSGKISYTEKPTKQINEEYKNFILKVSWMTVHKIVQTIPVVKKIYFSGYIGMIHSMKGNHYDACILSFIIDIDEYDQLLIENLQPEGILSNFQLRFHYDRDFKINETTPFNYVMKEKSEANIDLDNINPIAFEGLIKDLLNKMGLVAEVTQASHDGGIDVIAVNSNPIIGGRFVIQCKRYANIVSVDIIRDLYGTMTAERASKGILISTSDYSNDGWKFAQGKPIELINRSRLIQLLTDYGYKIAQKV